MNQRFLTKLILTLLVMAQGGLGCASSHQKPSGFDPSQGISEQNDKTQLPAPSFDSLPSPDLIAPGNQIRLSHLEDEKLNGKFRVDFDGYLRLPYDVRIKVKGLSLDQLKSKIADSYRPFFKSSSRINASLVDNSLWIEIRGLVSKPGKFLVHRRTSLEEILSLAGLVGEGAGKVNFIKITQGSEVRSISLQRYFDTGDVSQIPPWIGGDLLFFQAELDAEALAGDQVVQAKTVRLIGEVQKPGDLVYKKGADFFHYLAKAGGPTSAADLDRIVLIRGKDHERSSVEFNLEELKKMPKIDEGDILILHADKQSDFQKALQIASGIVTLITSIGFLIVVL